MSARNQPVSVSFDSTLSAIGNNTGIEVPDEKIAELGVGKRPAVVVNVNGYEYRNTIGVMGGKHLVSVSAAIRKETGLRGGDPIHVTLVLADSPREIEIPADFETALTKAPEARTFFGTLSNSLQRYHVDSINSAKTDETRQRRIDKAIATLVAGKQR
jgi:GrpB-like predicted nucleotidyltransferase (UPF0157 family)